MPLSIFLVEDSPVIRQNLVETIEDLVDAKVTGTAAGESEAITWLSENHDWTMAVIDLFLEQGSGLGVLKACASRPSSQYAVILSNYATADIRKRSLELGADAVFDKSSELDAFLAYCSNVAGRTSDG